MDISESLAPNSDQLDAIDLVGGPRVFTVSDVSKGNAEQPVNVHLAEFPRVWRPGKSMRRILAAGWGTDASQWKGRRVELFCDPSVQFGGQAVGGTRVSRMSHLDKPLKVPLLIKRGKSAVFTVDPLPDAPPPASSITPDQTRELVDAFDAAGITDRAARLTYCQDMAGRELTSASDLTADEAAFAINSLRQVGE